MTVQGIKIQMTVQGIKIQKTVQRIKIRMLNARNKNTNDIARNKIWMTVQGINIQMFLSQILFQYPGSILLLLALGCHIIFNLCKQLDVVHEQWVIYNYYDK